jgi:hypothetical protein
MKRGIHWATMLTLISMLGGRLDWNGLWASDGPEATGQPVPTVGTTGVNANLVSAPANVIPASQTSSSAGLPDSFAGAASQAGFQAPTQRLDLGQYGFENKLPPGYIAVNIRHLSSFPFDGDYVYQSDPFTKPKRLKHPRRTVPADIKALNGKKVAVLGYMLCFEFQFKGASHFALLRSQAGCCFGTAPLLNEWVDVRMNGLTSLYMDTPVVLMGTLQVKEIREYGNLMGLYSMKGDKLEKAIVKELGPGPN